MVDVHNQRSDLRPVSGIPCGFGVFSQTDITRGRIGIILMQGLCQAGKICPSPAMRDGWVFYKTIKIRKETKSMKITNEVFQVGGSELTSMEDAAIYLINFDGHAALVDAGCGNSTGRLFKNIEDCGIRPEQIEYLLITHCHFDHTGGAQAVMSRTNCQAVAHALDAPYLEEGDDRVTAARWYGASLEPFMIDLKLTGDREEIYLGQKVISAVHIPGHTPGSVAYFLESEGLKVLFGQDVHGPLNESLHSNRQDYIKSLNLLISLEADILCEGHYGIFRGKEEIEDFIQSFL